MSSASPAAVQPDPAAGDIFVTNFGGNTVTWYDGETGAFGGTFVPEGSGGLDRPVGIAFGSDGDLYVSSAGTHQVLRYDGDTGEFKGVFAEHELLRIPSLLQFGPDGDLYVGTFQGGRVLRFGPDDGEFRGVAGSGLLSPIGLRFDSEGHLYVASAGENRIARFDPATGTFLDDFVAAAAGLDFPTGLHFLPDGSLLVASLRTGEVRRFDGESGAATGLGGVLPDSVGPAGLALDSRGRILVADLNNSRLYRIAEVGGGAVLLATEGLDGPEGITLKPER